MLFHIFDSFVLGTILKLFPTLFSAKQTNHFRRLLRGILMNYQYSNVRIEAVRVASTKRAISPKKAPSPAR
jgi:hypothetical protein